MKYSTVTGHYGYSLGDRFLHEGQELDDLDAIVIERPDLFADALRPDEEPAAPAPKKRAPRRG